MEHRYLRLKTLTSLTNFHFAIVQNSRSMDGVYCDLDFFQEKRPKAKKKKKKFLPVSEVEVK